MSNEGQQHHLPHFTDKSSLLFVILGGFFVSNTLIAEFIGVKVFSLERTLGLQPVQWRLLNFDFSLDLTAGVLLWPVVFIMTDIINEYYGRQGVKVLSYLTIIYIGYAFLMIFLAINLTPADFWVMRNSDHGPINMEIAFSAVFGQGLWIIIGSLVAFLVGQLVDVGLFHFIKKHTGERYLWLRSTGSTLFSQFFDSFIVLFISFHINPSTNWDLKLIVGMWLVKYVYKVIMAILLTPLIYLIHIAIESYLGEALAAQLKERAMQQKTGFF